MRFLWILTLALTLIFAFQDVNGDERNKKTSGTKEMTHLDGVHQHPPDAARAGSVTGGRGVNNLPSNIHNRDHSGSSGHSSSSGSKHSGQSSHHDGKHKNKKHRKDKHKKHHKDGKKHHKDGKKHHKDGKKHHQDEKHHHQ